MIENPETAKHVLQLFLSINGQMDESVRAIEKELSPEEYKAYKKGIGYVMYEVFDKIIEPLCKRHPSLRPLEMEV